MCGIFGYVLNNKVDVYNRYILNQMLAIHNDKRGGDSWGSFELNTGKVNKGIGKLYGKKNSRANGFFHTRKATDGAVNLVNSHPFKQGNIIGCHNGIVSNHELLNRLYGRNFEVDSQHIFQHLNDDLDLQEIEMYGSIVYYDIRNPKTIYFGRFDGELSVGQVDGGIVFNSTLSGLEESVEMAELGKLKLFPVEDGVVYKIQCGKVYNTKKRLNFSDFFYQSYYGFDELFLPDYKSLTR